MLVEKAPDHANPEDPIWTTTIMTYELGSVVRGLVKARLKRLSGDHKGEKAYLAEARIELADLITQCHFLAEQMKWDRADLIQDGVERFEERMREIEEATEA